MFIPGYSFEELFFSIVYKAYDCSGPGQVTLNKEFRIQNPEFRSFSGPELEKRYNILI
jgi:hypothetical protein